jgi:guanylate kinase
VGDASPSRLTVLAGPSGVGKGTVSADVRARYPEIWISVSVTTRAPRPGEVDGVHYSFVDDEQFDAMIERGDLLEWAVIHGQQRSGTPRGPVEQMLASGRPALLEIDLQGARQVRASMPGARYVFRRLVGRGTEDDEEQARRLVTAQAELAAEREFDVTIVNADVRRATDDLVSCMGLRPRS